MCVTLLCRFKKTLVSLSLSVRVRLSKCASEKWCNERKESAIFFFPFFYPLFVFFFWSLDVVVVFVFVVFSRLLGCWLAGCKKKKRKNAPLVALSLSKRKKLLLSAAAVGLAKKAYTPSSSLGSPHALRRQNITAFFDYSQITNLKQEEDIEER
jgi:hypothetical protein